jgi:histone-binding protein RBBP4
MFGSVGDDSRLIIWDTRESPEKPLIEVPKAHAGDVHCLSFNPVNEHYVATGGADGIVKLWDLRNMSRCLHEFKGHTEGVFQVQWAPFSESVLGSCSSGAVPITSCYDAF